MRKNRRKLVGKKLLSKLFELQELGVPLTRLIQQYELAISAPHLQKLLDFLLSAETDHPQFKESLFPPWLGTEELKTQPADWKYIGRFPWGEWKHENDSTVH